MSLLKLLDENLVDHRSRHGRYYRLSSLILLVLVGFMSGRNSVSGIARFGKAMSDEDALRLGVRHKWRRPSQATLCVQLQGVDTQQLVEVLQQVLAASAPGEGKKDSGKRTHIAFDGKRLRATRDTSDPDSAGIHILQAFAENLMTILPQRRLGKGENEITAMLDLLDSVELEGVVVTGDAIFAQKHISSKIKAKGGDYMFPLKDNQKAMKAAVKQSLQLYGGKNARA